MTVGIPGQLLLRGPLRAEILCAAWELFSAILFASAVASVARSSVWPFALFTATLIVSAALVHRVERAGERGVFLGSVARLGAWLVGAAAIPGASDTRLWIATATFGLMAAAMRRAIYRRELLPPPVSRKDAAPSLVRWMRSRLGESAAMAGILGGHLLLLFGVAFLRAKSELLFRGWGQFLPILAVSSTAVYTLVMLLLTRGIAPAIQRGDFTAIRALPARLSWVNFTMWITCTGIGVFYFKSGVGPSSWRGGDALTQLGYAALFCWGIVYYQRGWDRDTVELVEASFKGESTGPSGESVSARPSAPAPERTPAIRERMLRDFGLPLVFAAALMLFSSISLYRALGGVVDVWEGESAVLALIAAFFMLMIAVGGVIARVARDLARPIVEVSHAAEIVASGDVDAMVPRVEGPSEITGLSLNVERMRDRLARSIAELESERANLETKVEARTKELQEALTSLREAQAALVQGERLASIGELVAGVAHEINNPLNAVAGSADPLVTVAADLRRVVEAYREAEVDLPLAKREKLAALRAEVGLDETLDDLVGISTVVKRATDRAVRIVQNLKNFARSTQEALPTNLHDGLEETLGLLAPRMRQSGITVDRRFGELPPVTCRAGELNQVFMNIIMNAVQALEVAEQPAPRITLSTWVERNEAVIAVADNGPGVPTTLKTKIFDPFFTTKPRGQGTGLGLSISTDIVRKHGGSLNVEMAEEKEGSRGARFVVRLPVRPEKRQ